MRGRARRAPEDGHIPAPWSSSRYAKSPLFSRRKIHFSRKRLELSAEGSAGGALRATFLSLDLEFSKRSRPRLQETTFRPMLGTACAKRTRSEKSTVAPRLETASQEQADRWRPSRRDRPVQKKRRNPAACARLERRSSAQASWATAADSPAAVDHRC